MPEAASANVQAANNQQPTDNVRYETYLWLASNTTATPALGQIVKFGTTSQGGTITGDGAYTPIQVILTTTSVDFTHCGVVVGGTSWGSIPVVGGLVMVATEGVVQALFDANNTTAGHLANFSTTTAGTCTDSATATLGKTMGVILQTVTISSGTALVWIHAHMV